MIEYKKKFNSTAKSAIRINKFISQAGIVSRRKADDLIQSEKVLINNKLAKPGILIDPSKDKVIINRKIIKPKDEFHYFAFYKPTGFITSMSDEQGESIQKFMPKNLRLFSVGRLDKETEGLLILSDDGDFANLLAHPKFAKEKVYHLEYGGKPTNIGKEGIIRQFIKGIMFNSKRYYVNKAKFVSDSKIEVTLHQGRSRQLRIMAGKIGLEVKSLKRIAVGKLKLCRLNIKPGQMIKIKKEDVL